MNFFNTLVISFALSLVIAIACLCKENLRNRAACYLWWALFPFLFPYHAQKYGIIKKQYKGWLLVLVSPCLLSICAFLLLCIGVCLAIAAPPEYGVPSCTNYHNREDLLKATGVDFPEVTPIDSFYYRSWCNSYEKIKFIPTTRMSKEDFRRFDLACERDSCCWNKDSLGYYYWIYPERPLDRTKGSRRRDVLQGDYVMVFVPLKGDTITVEDGWHN